MKSKEILPLEIRDRLGNFDVTIGLKEALVAAEEENERLIKGIEQLRGLLFSYAESTTLHAKDVIHDINSIIQTK